MRVINHASVILASPDVAAQGADAAPSIDQVSYQQVAKSTSVSITPTLAAPAPTVVWYKVSGPDWISVNISTGEITGNTPSVGDAHYIQVAAMSSGGSDTMTLILVVGSQTIYYMDGVATNPATLAEAYTDMSSGDVLVIPDGTYTGTDNTFNGDGTIIFDSGDASNYTSWIAENPLQADFPSVRVKGVEYVTIKGLHYSGGFQLSGELKGGINTNHVKIMLCSSTHDGLQATYLASYILFEDCFAWGDGRSVFRVGSNGFDSHHIIFRRCVARHDYYADSEPSATFMHYGGDDVLFQNCIAIDQAYPKSTHWPNNDLYGSWETKFGDRVDIKDSIMLNNLQYFHRGDGGDVDVVWDNCVVWDTGTGATTTNTLGATYNNMTVGVVNDDGENVGQNTYNSRSSITDPVWNDSIFYDVELAGDDSDGYRDDTILKDCALSDNILFFPVQTSPAVANGTSVNPITGINPVTGAGGNDIAGILYPHRIEFDSDAYTNGVGATIEHRRGTSGTLWSETGYDTVGSDSLWPWPYEELIKAGMETGDVTSPSVTGARGFCVSGETLSNYIWAYMGNTVPPQNVTIVEGDTELTLYWEAPVSLTNITQFDVYDVTGDATPQVPGALTAVGTVSGNTTFKKTITGLTNAQAYNLVVTATDSVKGESSYSYIITATPSA